MQNLSDSLLEIILSGFVGAIIGYLLNQYFSGALVIHNPNKYRAKKIKGKWVGNYTQVEQNPIDLELKFLKRFKRIEGKGTQDSEGVTLRGQFLDRDRLLFTYKNPDRSLLQFGSILLTMDGEGKNLEGGFLGYGHNSQNIIYGKVSLSKSTNQEH